MYYLKMRANKWKMSAAAKLLLLTSWMHSEAGAVTVLTAPTPGCNPGIFQDNKETYGREVKEATFLQSSTKGVWANVNARAEIGYNSACPPYFNYTVRENKASIQWQHPAKYPTIVTAEELSLELSVVGKLKVEP